MKIPINQILPNPYQPRSAFPEEEMKSLAQSMQENGLVQPITVERIDEHNYIIVDGGRRFEAAKTLGWKNIEAFVRESLKKPRERLLLALVANVQRENLGPIDEAGAYVELIKEFGSIDAVSEKTGVKKTAIQNRLSLLDFPPSVQSFFNSKSLPIDNGVIYALKKLDPSLQEKVATIAATRRWSAIAIRSLATKMIRNPDVTEADVDRRMKDKPLGEEGKRRYAKTLSKQDPGTRSTKSGEHIEGYNALSVVPDVIVAPGIKDGVRKTCMKCSLYDMASKIVCGECPLPAFLKILDRQAMEGKP